MIEATAMRGSRTGSATTSAIGGRDGSASGGVVVSAPQRWHCSVMSRKLPGS
jgi:hypothetical protein